MSFNLFDLALLVLIPTTLVRAAVLLRTFQKFVNIFGNKSDFKVARQLMKELEIPGFSNFIRPHASFRSISLPSMSHRFKNSQ